MASVQGTQFRFFPSCCCTVVFNVPRCDVVHHFYYFFLPSKLAFIAVTFSFNY